MTLGSVISSVLMEKAHDNSWEAPHIHLGTLLRILASILPKRGSEESAQIFQSIDRLVLDAAVWNGLMVDIFRIYSTDMKDYREKEQIIWEEKNGVKDAYALEEDDEELQREADMVDGLLRMHRTIEALPLRTLLQAVHDSAPHVVDPAAA